MVGVAACSLPGGYGARSSVVELWFYTPAVGGSIPSAPTNRKCQVDNGPYRLAARRGAPRPRGPGTAATGLDDPSDRRLGRVRRATLTSATTRDVSAREQGEQYDRHSKR